MPQYPYVKKQGWKNSKGTSSPSGFPQDTGERAVDSLF